LKIYKNYEEDTINGRVYAVKYLSVSLSRVRHNLTKLYGRDYHKLRWI